MKNISRHEVTYEHEMRELLGENILASTTRLLH